MGNYVIIDYMFVFIGAVFVVPRSEELGIATLSFSQDGI